MPRPLRLFLSQFRSEPLLHHSHSHSDNPNLSKLPDLFKQASQTHNCDVIVFPEYFLTGVIAHDPHRLAHPEHPVDGKQGSMKYEKEQNEERERQERELEREESTWIKYMSDLAKEYSIDVVAGTIVEKEWIHRDNSSSSSMNRKEEEKEGKKPRLFNSAYYIDKRGEIVGRYRKRNLWHPEKEYLHRGIEDHQVFQTDKFKAGLLICWDLAWPEAFRSLMLKGAEVVIIPTCWVATDAGELGLKHNKDSEKTFLDSTLISRAFENECCVVFVNCGGPEEEGFIGRSGVTMPFLGEVAKAKTCDEEAVVCEVDLDVLEDARNVYGIKKDLEHRIRLDQELSRE